MILPLASASGTGQDKDKFVLGDDEKNLLELTNLERKKHKLPPLKASPLLCKVARAHSANMAKQGKMDHNLDGKDPYDRIKAVGYKYAVAGENLAVGDLAQEQVMKAWMKSQVHRENILDDEFTEIGLGMAKNDKGKIYYTQVFGTPRE
jgi:uncharacterized protein YkwD